MNIVALVGNLATDPEFRRTNGEHALCTFRLAVSRSNGTDADFFTVVTWDRQAEVCRDHLSIGRRVAVEGRLHHSTWTAEDDTRRSRVEVIAHRVHMIGPPRKPSDEQPSGTGAASGEATETAETSPDFAVV